MDENDDRQDLYDEFESEVVKHGNPEAFFDENDLVEIFDYASDLDNNIVKMEVLLYGAVHYPKSEALATRRAWFYSSLGDLEAASEVNRRVTHTGVLNRLLDLRAGNRDQSRPLTEELAAIVDSTDDFDDEGIIQFVDFCMESGEEEWLTANKDLVQSKCSYPQTFIYEFADRLEEGGNLEAAARLFEELTMLEPFTLDFWQRLATVQINMEDYEGALTSADYALAIDPSSVLGARIKGAALYRLERDMPTVAALYESVLKTPEAEDSDASTLAAALVELDRQAEAVDLLKSYIESRYHPKLAIDVLLVLDIEAAKPFVKRSIKEAMLTESDVLDWAKDHIIHNQYTAASTIILIYHEMKGLLLGVEFAAEVCYYALRFTDIVDLYENHVYEEMKAEPVPGLTYPYIMSLVRLGMREKALAVTRDTFEKAEAYRAKFGNHEGNLSAAMRYSPATTHTLLTGYSATLHNILLALQSTNPIPADDFDPML